MKAEIESDVDVDIESKRKRKIESSVSETSLVEGNKSPTQENDGRKTKQKKKKSKVSATEEERKSDDAEISKTIEKQLKEINQKLSNVVTKNDAFLKDMIKEIVSEMKEEVLKSANSRIDILEGTLFCKQQENDKLKDELGKLKKQLETANEENSKLQRQIQQKSQTLEGKLNDLDQYGRRNNIRVSGIRDQENETAEESVKIVVDTLNKKIPNLNLKDDDIDIAHRIGKYEKDKKRQIIVKFQSRMKKSQVMRDKKGLKGENIFINDDLTRLNQEVFNSVRIKKKDIVASAWTFQGNIRYKDFNNHVQTIHFSNFKYWLDLPWP